MPVADGRSARPASARRMLAVSPVDHPGGAEMALVRLLDRLAPRGWDVTVTTPTRGRLAEQALERGWRWEPLALGGLRARRGARAALSWPRARRLAARADVVYLNGTVCGRLLPALRGRQTVLHAQAVVLAASEAVARSLTGLGAEVVYCPIEPNPEPVLPPWPPGAGPLVGFVGRLEPRKGPLDLIAAAPAIHAQQPDARIVLVGDDPYGSDPDYVARVRAAPEVEHYGWIDGAAGLMSQLDVLVAPSRQEPFGTVLAEAMAVGTPVVATRVGGLAEVVQDGVTGRLVAPGAPDQLAAAVLEVLEHRAEMGRAARSWARRFDADDYAERVERLIAP
jgi:glycosyltransferase involved in cell wall biosynthesis